MRDPDFYDSVSAVQQAVVDERATIANAQAYAQAANTANANAAAATTTQSTPVKVTVKSGDTLSAIAAANDLTLKELLALNPKFKSDPKYQGGNRIFSGTTVNVGTTAKPTVTTAPTPGAGKPAPEEPGGGTTDGGTTDGGTTDGGTTGGGTTDGGTTTGGTTGGGVTGGGLIPGAGGAGPDAAATSAILEEISRLTQQIASMQAAAAAEAAKPKVVGTRTVRKTGGVVEVVEVMSDGSTGKVLNSYTDFGARDSVMKMFENTGLGNAFIKSLMDTIDKVYTDNIMPTEEQVLNSIYTSDAYKQRFAANEIIRKRMAEGKGTPGDRLLTPYEYTKTESAYKEIMSQAGLPTGFYDQPEDFTKFIAELGTSVSEITERVNIAKQALQDADINIKTALKNYYGLTENDMVAYLLDPQRAFTAINSRFAYSTAALKEQYQTAEVGGAAIRAGLGAGQGVSEVLSKEIVKAGKQDLAEKAFQGAAQKQKDYQRLMGLYGEEAGVEDLARESLALAGGAEVGIKTRKLASKERAKFQQKSAVDKTSLGSRLKTPDI